MAPVERYFDGKVTVITGAASGIGKDMAELLASWGAKLALTDLQAAPLEQTAEACRQAGAEVLAVAADVSDRDAMAAMAADVLSRWGRGDIVIANAGMGGLNPGYDFDPELHDRFVAVNVNGLAYTLAPYIPGMVERGAGHLAVVASLAGFRGLPGAASYSSTKAAQATFMESLRVDLRPRALRSPPCTPASSRPPWLTMTSSTCRSCCRCAPPRCSWRGPCPVAGPGTSSRGRCAGSPTSTGCSPAGCTIGWCRRSQGRTGSSGPSPSEAGSWRPPRRSSSASSPTWPSAW